MTVRGDEGRFSPPPPLNRYPSKLMATYIHTYNASKNFEYFPGYWHLNWNLSPVFIQLSKRTLCPWKWKHMAEISTHYLTSVFLVNLYLYKYPGDLVLVCNFLITNQILLITFKEIGVVSRWNIFINFKYSCVRIKLKSFYFAESSRVVDS